MALKKPPAVKKKQPAQPKEKPSKKAMNTSNKKFRSKKGVGEHHHWQHKQDNS